MKGEPCRSAARQLLRDARLNGTLLLGPPLLEYEIESILQRFLYRGSATITAVNAALAAFYAVKVQLVTYPDLVRRARRLAREFDQERIYDSIYAALAERRGCDFWTVDKVFYDAVKHDLSFVKYLPDFSSSL